MVCINARHFIGFDRLWISFLSTSGLLGFHYSCRSMFNSELGTANRMSVPCAFFLSMDTEVIPKLGPAASRGWEHGRPPFWGCSCLCEIKQSFSTQCGWFSLSCPTMGRAHPVPRGQLCPWTARTEEQSNTSKQGSRSAPSYFHPGQSSCQPSIIFSPAFT